MPRRSSSASSPRPAAANADRQVEVHARAQLAFELAPGGGPRRLDHPPAGSDQDPLLRLRLDPHERADEGQAILACLHLVDHDLDRVRHLLEGAPQHLLAHELGQHHLERLVGAVLGGEEEGALGHQPGEVVAQGLDAAAGARADGEDLVARLERRGRAERRERVRAVEPVDLVDGDDDGHAGTAQGAGDEAVARAHALLGVEDEQRGVGLRHLGLDAVLHALGQCVAGPLDPRQVDEHQLRVLQGGHPADGPSCGLGLVRHDRHLAPDHAVDERRFADVRAPRERDQARAREGRGYHFSSSACSASISQSSVSWSIPVQVQRAVQDGLAQVLGVGRADDDVAQLARAGARGRRRRSGRRARRSAPGARGTRG